MTDPIRTCPVTGTVRVLDVMLPATARQPLVVWWYGGIQRNPAADSVPRVAVFLRRVLEDGTPGSWVQLSAALTHLGLLRIGSIWSEGIARSQILFHEHTFEVDFTPGHWDFVSPSDSNTCTIDASDYLLRYPRDRNWLLRFRLRDHDLLIPCLEYFTRCYGRSAEVRRILATYPWPEVESRMLGPCDEPDTDVAWFQIVPPRLRITDTVFLAHLQREDAARLASKAIYSQAESAYGRGSYAFLKIGPWFHDRAALRVTGKWINGGTAFLALGINGCSDPRGPKVVVIRPVAGSTVDTPFGVESIEGAPVRRTLEGVDLPDLTTALEPDHDAETTEIRESDVKVIGPPRPIETVKAERPRSRNGGGAVLANDPTAFATGDPCGGGKRVGMAQVYARTVVPSAGVVQEMWNAMQALHAEYPTSVQSVHWYTFADGFRDDADFKLIGLRRFNPEEEESLAPDQKRWLYFNVAGLQPRGILVTRIVIDHRAHFVLEIQRRTRCDLSENGEWVELEEHFKGLAFTLAPGADLDAWLRDVLSALRYTKGVFGSLCARCPGMARPFVHSRSPKETDAGRTALLNALRKLGVQPGVSRRPANGQSDARDGP
ncbi:hypothetical protein [Thiocapsa imhoffii]|uniref:hypothetical protein n=1 Tax=Thiocapsa imhoffii TaxID=382777 RepID=UPI0019063E7B|nr:hypothetical protein [Thiocapsa imhoffii]